MDGSNFVSGTIGGVSVAFVFAIAYAVYKMVNHKRCRSACCNREISASFDIDETTMAQKVLVDSNK